MVLTMSDEQVFHKEEFQQPVPFWCLEMIESTDTL